MGVALELAIAQVTAPGGTVTAMTALTGDTLTIRNTSKKVSLLAAWQQRQAAGVSRIVSPLLHDNVRGIQFGGPAGFGFGCSGRPLQEVYAQDVLSISGSGSGVAGDIEQTAILVRYDDLPGIDGNFIGADDFYKRALNVIGVRQSVASVATGQYGASASIVALDDVLKANTEYAFLGIQMPNGNVTAVGVRSPDWGNLRVGVPAQNDGYRYRRYFLGLAVDTGLRCIPVFNSANKATTLVDMAGNENAGTSTPTIMLAELSPAGRR